MFIIARNVLEVIILAAAARIGWQASRPLANLAERGVETVCASVTGVFGGGDTDDAGAIRKAAEKARLNGKSEPAEAKVEAAKAAA